MLGLVLRCQGVAGQHEDAYLWVDKMLNRPSTIRHFVLDPQLREFLALVQEVRDEFIRLEIEAAPSVDGPQRSNMAA